MTLKHIITVILIINASMLFTSCSGGNMPEEKVTLPSIKDVPVEKWKNLAQKKIYFGHRSVGKNIIDGVNDLNKEYPFINFNIIETTNPTDFKKGIFAHARNGENRKPISKIDEFAATMEKLSGEEVDFAFFKFCHVDYYKETDVEKIFNEYKKSMENLRAKYPRTNFIHFTVPLETTQISFNLKTWLKYFGKANLKWKWWWLKRLNIYIFNRDDNVRRNVFNKLLLEEYDGKEPVFDLAKFESRNIDGTTETFVREGKRYLSLAPDFAIDTGHLNEIGRKAVAEQLIILLSDLN